MWRQLLVTLVGIKLMVAPAVLDVAPGVWLLAAPWLIEHSQSATLNSLAAGAVTLLLAVGGRADMNRYGGGWRALFPISRPNPD